MKHAIILFLATASPALAVPPGSLPASTECASAARELAHGDPVTRDAIEYCCGRLDPSLRLTHATQDARARSRALCVGTYLRRAGR